MIRCTLVGPKGTWISEATKKAAGQHAGLGDLVVVQLLQADGRAGRGQRRPGEQHRPGEDAFGDVHG
ncbi:MAG: hypothetical protein MZV70_06450 [Desulfobacterales bacterium]|nr:hypothetical protein [Desulfobacterales bacterium]